MPRPRQAARSIAALREPVVTTSSRSGSRARIDSVRGVRSRITTTMDGAAERADHLVGVGEVPAYGHDVDAVQDRPVGELHRHVLVVVEDHALHVCATACSPQSNPNDVGPGMRSARP